ncbi:hypothetical protein KIPB_016742, partial [Kipferlia bialata]
LAWQDDSGSTVSSIVAGCSATAVVTLYTASSTVYPLECGVVSHWSDNTETEYTMDTYDTTAYTYSEEVCVV